MELELRRVSGEHEAAEHSQTNCPLVSSPLKGRLSCYLLAAVVSRRGCVSHKAELCRRGASKCWTQCSVCASLSHLSGDLPLQNETQDVPGHIGGGRGRRCLAYRQKRGVHATDIQATTDVELEKRRKGPISCKIHCSNSDVSPERRKDQSPFFSPS